MITKWNISNFKSIRDETELSLGKLTVFAGANSSGKSTFIQSILLVAQTLEHKVRSLPIVLNGPLVSLGQYEDLKFNSEINNKDNFIENDDELNSISVQCRCERLSTKRKIPNAIPMREYRSYFGHYSLTRIIDFKISFNLEESNIQTESVKNQPRLEFAEISCPVDGMDEIFSISIRSSDINTAPIDTFKKFLDATDSAHLEDQIYTAELDEHSTEYVRIEYPSAKPSYCTLRHFLPYQMICEINESKEDAYRISESLTKYQIRHKRIWHRYQFDGNSKLVVSSEIMDVFKKILGNSNAYRDLEKELEKVTKSSKEAVTIENFFEALSRIKNATLREVIKAVKGYDNLEEDLYDAINRSRNSTKNSNYVLARIPSAIDEASAYIEDFFSSSIKYLGPLRDTPKAVYPILPTSDPHDVGSSGERTASVLDLYKNTSISYIPSSRFDKNTKKINKKMISCTLEEAVNDWLQYLGVAEAVKSEDQGKLGHGLKVGISNSTESRDLTHVGVGVSQVLPILVTCLLVDEDTTLVFEQPELRLHPKVQALLGDFFVSVALSNKQCIVESHSEYLVDRLRYRFAASRTYRDLKSLIRIYFVTKEDGVSKFQNVGVDKYGSFSDWPEGFFDESHQQSASILKAAVQKRSKPLSRRRVKKND